MWVKAYSPNVVGVEVVQRTEKRKRRAKLTYMRYDYSLLFVIIIAKNIWG